MRCEVAREALSARIDGENEGVPSARVDEHLANCAECREWYAAASNQSLSLLSGPRVIAPDRSDDLARAIAGLPASRDRVSQSIIQIGLTVTGGAQIVIAMMQMTGVDFGMAARGAGMPAHHLLNETTAWELALGVGMVIAAWWRRALPGLLVVLAVFTVVLAGYVVADAVDGAVTVSRMLAHIPVLVGLLLAAWGSRASLSARAGVTRWERT